jgi:WD40 repeat protein
MRTVAALFHCEPSSLITTVPVEPSPKAISETTEVLLGHTERVDALAFSPDGSRLASGSDDYTIKLWDAARWQEIATLYGHTNIVWSLAFAPNGEFLVSGSADWSAKIWEAGK